MSISMRYPNFRDPSMKSGAVSPFHVTDTRKCFRPSRHFEPTASSDDDQSQPKQTGGTAEAESSPSPLALDPSLLAVGVKYPSDDNNIIDASTTPHQVQVGSENDVQRGTPPLQTTVVDISRHDHSDDSGHSSNTTPRCLPSSADSSNESRGDNITHDGDQDDLVTETTDPSEEQEEQEEGYRTSESEEEESAEEAEGIDLLMNFDFDLDATLHFASPKSPVLSTQKKGLRFRPDLDESVQVKVMKEYHADQHAAWVKRQADRSRGGISAWTKMQQALVLCFLIAESHRYNVRLNKCPEKRRTLSALAPAASALARRLDIADPRIARLLISDVVMLVNEEDGVGRYEKLRDQLIVLSMWLQ